MFGTTSAVIRLGTLSYALHTTIPALRLPYLCFACTQERLSRTKLKPDTLEFDIGKPEVDLN